MDYVIASFYILGAIRIRDVILGCLAKLLVIFRKLLKILGNIFGRFHIVYVEALPNDIKSNISVTVIYWEQKVFLMIPALYFINFTLLFSDCEFKIVEMMFKDKFSKKVC